MRGKEGEDEEEEGGGGEGRRRRRRKEEEGGGGRRRREEEEVAGGGRRCAYQSLRNIPFPPPGISSAPLSEVVLMLARCIMLMSVTTPEACLSWEGLGVTMSPSGRS
jgi:hypothetical protein